MDISCIKEFQMTHFLRENLNIIFPGKLDSNCYQKNENHISQTKFSIIFLPVSFGEI